MKQAPFRIEMNFAPRDYRLASRLAAAMVLLCAVLAAAICLMLWHAASLRGERFSLEQQAAELAARTAKLGPALEQRERLLRDLQSMSGMVQARSFSWTGLLTGIERVFPAGAALDTVKYDPKDRSLTLEGRALSPEALRNFMAGLEQSPLFADPLLKHQSVDKGILTFTVGARYR